MEATTNGIERIPFLRGLQYNGTHPDTVSDTVTTKTVPAIMLGVATFIILCSLSQHAADLRSRCRRRRLHSRPSAMKLDNEEQNEGGKDAEQNGSLLTTVAASHSHGSKSNRQDIHRALVVQQPSHRVPHMLPPLSPDTNELEGALSPLQESLSRVSTLTNSVVGRSMSFGDCSGQRLREQCNMIDQRELLKGVEDITELSASHRLSPEGGISNLFAASTEETECAISTEKPNLEARDDKTSFVPPSDQGGEGRQEPRDTQASTCSSLTDGSVSLDTSVDSNIHEESCRQDDLTDGSVGLDTSVDSEVHEESCLQDHLTAASAGLNTSVESEIREESCLQDDLTDGSEGLDTGVDSESHEESCLQDDLTDGSAGLDTSVESEIHEESFLQDDLAGGSEGLDTSVDSKIREESCLQDDLSDGSEGLDTSVDSEIHEESCLQDDSEIHRESCLHHGATPMNATGSVLSCSLEKSPETAPSAASVGRDIAIVGKLLFGEESLDGEGGNIGNSCCEMDEDLPVLLLDDRQHIENGEGHTTPTQGQGVSVPFSTEDIVPLAAEEYIRDIYFVPVVAPMHRSEDRDEGEPKGADAHASGALDVLLGLELLDSSCAGTHPCVAKVASRSPLIGRIFEGDFILKVNGTDVTGFSSDEVQSLLSSQKSAIRNGDVAVAQKSVDKGIADEEADQLCYEMIKLTIMSSRCDAVSDDGSSVGPDSMIDVGVPGSGVEL